MNLTPHPTKILFLYSELAGYFVACLKTLTKNYIVDVTVFRKNINPEAPFSFSSMKNVTFLERGNFSNELLMDFSKSFSPDIIICSGWKDKSYLSVCRMFNKKIPVVLLMDNQWKNTVNQFLISFLGKYYLGRFFSNIWIPGKPQYPYAVKLGFAKEKIITGFYAADVNLFNGYFQSQKEEKKKKFPKRFIYIARYYEFKGLKDLWQAFVELQREHPNEWELWCLGTGNIPPIQHSKIKHFGFVQPEKLGEFFINTGVYILPSRIEPWGVSLQEAAAAGMPLICSEEVGAASEFLMEGYNGYLHEAQNVSSLKYAMKKVMNLKEEELNRMGERSAELAQKITPKKWADTLMQLIN